jgi:cytochrome P450
MAIISFTNVAISLAALYVATRIYYTATTGAHRRALSKKHGCLPAPQRQNTVFPSFLPTFGLDLIISRYRNFKSHTLLQAWPAARSAAHSHTIHFTLFGLKNLFITDEPENVKCMLATNFDAWSLGQDRIDQMSSWLGKGIFTNEGQAWKHSREMLRPCFERSAVADVSLLDKHTTRLLDLLPGDGSEVDLQPLFHELTMDIATEFLFGRSMNMLDRTVERTDVKEFVEAFEYAGDPMLNENQERWGWLGLFMRDGKRERCIKYMNGRFFLYPHLLRWNIC